MEFEEKFGVKVSLAIPEKERLKIYRIWESILAGNNSYSNPSEGNFMTSYEHMLQCSGVGWPPDPFKILATYQVNPDLERIVRRRKVLFPEGAETRILAPPLFFPRFKELTGSDVLDCLVGYVNPRVSDDGRVPIPRVVAFYDEMAKQKLELSDTILEQLQFPTTCIMELSKSVKIREVFDYRNGYRIEIAS